MQTKRDLPMKRKKGFSEVESLDCDEIEDEGFIEGDVDFGTPIMAFSFGVNTESKVNIEPVTTAPAVPPVEVTTKPAESFINTAPRGVTPPIDGEYFTVNRSYQMRPSTVRKLTELKAKHPDINVCLNSILDDAISHYYNYIANENGNFSSEDTFFTGKPLRELSSFRDNFLRIYPLFMSTS